MLDELTGWTKITVVVAVLSTLNCLALTWTHRGVGSAGWWANGFIVGIAAMMVKADREFRRR